MEGQSHFKTVPAVGTPASMRELVELYDDAVKDRKVPHLVLLAVFNLDFLCIHPFRDGNGRLSILKTACKEFEDRLGQTKSSRGAKTELIQRAARNFSSEFSVSDLERACPDASRDMIRKVLRDLQANGDVECIGRGPGGPWRKRKRGNTHTRG